MIGFLFGTACLIGLAKVAACGGRWRHAHACGGYGGGGPGGWGGHGGHGWHGRRGWRGGWGGPGRGCGPGYGGEGEGGEARGGEGFGRRMALRWLFERLDTTPGQEKVIREAADELHDAMRDSKAEWRKVSADVSEALKSPEFGHAAMGTAFSRLEQNLESFKTAATGALGSVHGALDERQRKILADLIASGGWSWGRDDHEA